MYKKIFFLVSVVICIFAFAGAAHAADYEYPVYVGDQGFDSLQSAYSYSSSLPIRVVGTLDVYESFSITSRDVIFDSTSHVITHSSYIALFSSNVQLLGTIEGFGPVTSISVSQSNVVVTGDITSHDYTAIYIISDASFSFNGSSIVSKFYCVDVGTNAINSNLVINGGSFYSSSGVPLRPIDAFHFPEGVDVVFDNGRIFAVSNISILSDIGRLVSASVVWLGSFAESVILNPLLLVFFIVVFVGLGIGLIRRLLF